MSGQRRLLRRQRMHVTAATQRAALKQAVAQQLLKRMLASRADPQRRRGTPLPRRCTMWRRCSCGSCSAAKW